MVEDFALNIVITENGVQKVQVYSSSVEDQKAATELYYRVFPDLRKLHENVLKQRKKEV